MVSLEVYYDGICMKEMLMKLLPQLGRKCICCEPENIVLVHLENMGDFVLFSSVLLEIRKNFPNSKITVVAQRENRFLVKNCEIVNNWVWISGHRKPRVGEATGRELPYLRKVAVSYLHLLIKFRGRIDVLIGPDWLLVSDQEQLRRNILFRKANLPGGFMSKHLDYSPEKFVEYNHQVKRNLSVLEVLGLRVFDDSIANWILPDLKEVTNKESHDLTTRNDEKRIIIGLGAGHSKRTYPSEFLAKVCLEIAQKYPKCFFTLIGPESLSSDQLQEEFENVPTLDYQVGKLDVCNAASLLNGADLYIGNDSGFAHIAATFKTPTLVLSAHPKDGDPWHLHSPLRYHPWKTEHVVLQPEKLLETCSQTCQATSPHCINSIKIEDIIGAALKLLKL